MISLRSIMSSAFLIPLLILTASVVGCAKRPVGITAVTPAPTGAASAMSSQAAKEGRTHAAAASSSAAAARPRPAEFRSGPALAEIHFDFDRYAIRPQDADILVQNAKWLKANPADLVLIEGHADERGTNEYNLVLGDRRARATKDFLVAQGVPATRMTTISYGEERPLCTGHNEACWAKNRRSHFLVKPQ